MKIRIGRYNINSGFKVEKGEWWNLEKKDSGAFTLNLEKRLICNNWIGFTTQYDPQIYEFNFMDRMIRPLSKSVI